MIICWGNDNTPPPPTTMTFDPPVSMDPCNESGKVNPPVWTSKPVTNDQIVVTEDVNGTITVAPKEGFVFAAGTVTTFSLPTDDPADLCSVPEPDPEVVTPPEPTQVDPCNEPGTADNVKWTCVPPSAVGYTVVENGDTVTMTAVKGYVFDDGKTVLTYTLNPDSGVPCYVPPTVVTFTPPAFIDPCYDPGDVNAPVWTSMPAGDAITYSVNGGTITVAPKPGFVFAEGTVTTFSLPLEDPSNLCYNPVLSIPITPDVKDVCNPVGVTPNAVWVVPVTRRWSPGNSAQTATCWPGLQRATSSPLASRCTTSVSHPMMDSPARSRPTDVSAQARSSSDCPSERGWPPTPGGGPAACCG